jgi:hypothetical protein
LPKPFNLKAAALKAGWRSGLEEALGKQLVDAKIRHEYEKLTVRYLPRPKERRYKPDFVLLDNGIIIESKGRFITADRQKHLEIQAQHPDLDIRFVFSNSRARISKQSRTTYAMWCVGKGFDYADKEIPLAWLEAPPNIKSLAAIEALR